MKQFEEMSDAEITAKLKQNKIDKGFAEKEPEWESEGLTLRDRYIEPPFSVLDAKTGSWQERKKKWLELGIKSEVGRDATSFSTLEARNRGATYMPNVGNDISIFDPALCELMYSWFCPKDGTILDPFAGGSVRGIIAHKMGYKYTGIELRQEQVDSNIEQAKEILPADNQPTWICGDSEEVMKDWSWETNHFDMIFSCPPYANLEVYSDLPGDLSKIADTNYKSFIEKYERIIWKASDLLAESGDFAVFVVGDIRDKNGNYLDFISDTKKAFTDPFKTALKLYNDMVLLDPIGTAMIRASKFGDNKKVVKIHQNVLCFRKQ